MKDILSQAKPDSVIAETISSTDSSSLSLWFWIALVEFVIITFLLLRLKKERNSPTFGDLSKGTILDAKGSSVDMDNLMNSINKSKDLYKELSKSCHPDRFINSDKQKLAEGIFQEISNNKRDFNKLAELKQRAITELNINFK
jgi:hypothetical protein